MGSSRVGRACLAAVVAATFLARSGAAESWVCSYVGQERLILAIRGGLLRAQLHDAVSYNVLQNNEFAIIAEGHYGNFDPLRGEVVISITTVTIDKRSSRFTYTIGQRGSDVRQQTGKCRGYDEGLENSLPAAPLFSGWESRDVEIGMLGR